MKTLIIIWTISFIIEIIHLYFALKSLKKELKKPEYSIIIQVYRMTGGSLTGKRLKKNVFNPYTYFLFVISFFILSPFLFLITLKQYFKKLFKIKTKLDELIEEEKTALESAKKESEKFMETEGTYISRERDRELEEKTERVNRIWNDIDDDLLIINVKIKVKEGDLCIVKNYRKKPQDWEPGKVEKVSVGIRADGTYRAVYEVRLDRKSETRSRAYPDGGCPLFLTVSDYGIDKLSS